MSNQRPLLVILREIFVLFLFWLFFCLVDRQAKKEGGLNGFPK